MVLSGLTDGVWQQEPFTIPAFGGPLFVFDAAFAGEDLGNLLPDGNYATVDATADAYSVESADVDPLGDLHMHLTRLRPTPPQLN